MEATDSIKLGLAIAAGGLGFYELNRKYKWEAEYRKWGEGLAKLSAGNLGKTKDLAEDMDKHAIDRPDLGKNFVFYQAEAAPDKLPVYWTDSRQTTFINYWRFVRIMEDTKKAITGQPREKWEGIKKKVMTEGLEKYRLRLLTMAEIAEIAEMIEEYSQQVDSIRIETTANLQMAFESFNFTQEKTFNTQIYSAARNSVRGRYDRCREIIREIKDKFGSYSPELVQSLNRQENDATYLVENMERTIEKMQRNHQKAFNDKIAAVRNQAIRFAEALKREKAEAEAELNSQLSDLNGYRSEITGTISEIQESTGKDYVSLANAFKPFASMGTKPKIAWSEKVENKALWVTYDSYTNNYTRDIPAEAWDNMLEKDGIASVWEVKTYKYEKVQRQAEDMTGRPIFDNFGKPVMKEVKELVPQYGYTDYNIGGMKFRQTGVAAIYSAVSKKLGEGLSSINSAWAEINEEKNELMRYKNQIINEYTPEFLQNNINNGLEYLTDPTAVMRDLTQQGKAKVEAYAKQEAADWLRKQGITQIGNDVLAQARAMGNDFMAMGQEKLNDILGENLSGYVNSYGLQAFQLLNNASGFFSGVMSDFRNIGKAFQGDFESAYKGIDGLYKKFLGQGTVLGTILRSIPMVGQALMVYDVLSALPGFEHLGGALIGSVADTFKAVTGNLAGFAAGLGSGDIGKTLANLAKMPFELIGAAFENLENIAKGLGRMLLKMGDYVGNLLGKVFEGSLDKLLTGDILGAAMDIAKNVKRMITNLAKDIGNFIASGFGKQVEVRDKEIAGGY